MDNKAHTSEERIWAALAHVSGLLFFFGLAPLLIWATQRKKSSYVAFHALQAFGYQIISIVLGILASVVFPFLMVLILIPLIVVIAQFQPNSESMGILMPFLMMVLIFVPLLVIFGIYLLFSVLGAAFVFMDKDFRYPVMGNWLARYLNYTPENTQNPLNPDAEERWVAGLGHASVVITFFGLLVPLATWVAEKNRSALIRFQSLQALIYQGIGAAGYLLTQVSYMVFYFLFMGIFVFAAAQPDKLAGTKILSGIGGLSFLLFFCCGGMITIATPVYYLLSFFAAVRVVGGHNFKFPWLGSLIWSKQNKPITVNVQAEGEHNVNRG